ncbi:MAG: DNA primase [Clostridia bacterium]|nr:DNA primase [Clostridia bacterium]
MNFDSKFIEKLKDKCDIVDVVSRYVHLEKRGNSFWACCPFHHEKTPSFSVNGREQYYYCFGCKKSGDVINFVMEMESLDFADAVKLLAEKAGLPLPEIKEDDEKVRAEKRKKERLLSLLKDAAIFYAHNLRKNGADKHVEYILKRGLKTETVAKFGIGASLDYTSLPAHLKSLGYTDGEMVDSGAVGSKDGRLYDSLGGRLIIPVIDQFGSVVAFCGRIIEKKDNVGKYVNTRETAVFSKGKTLFNLNNLKKLKNGEGLDSVIIVEGHMDVVSLVQGGFNNVVASMGTSLTKDQARIIKRYADKVFISYDGDFAGQKAAIRGLEILRDEGLEVKVVSLPDGMDPDDVIKKMGAEEYRKLLDGALPLIDFKLDIVNRTFDLKSVDGKRKYVSAAIRVIKESPSAAEQEDLLKRVRDLTGFTLEALKRDLYSSDEPQAANESQPRVLTQVKEERTDKLTAAARVVLSCYLFPKPYAPLKDLENIEFPEFIHNRIKDYIIAKRKAGEEPRFNSLYEEFGEEYKEEISAIAGIRSAEDDKSYDKEKYFADCVKTLKRHSLEKENERLLMLFKEEKDVERRRVLAAELNKVLKEKNKLTK